jgi:hypothetical protein
MMLAAEVVLLSPLLVNILVVAVVLLLALMVLGNSDGTRGQALPDLEEDPDPVQVAYLRRQTSGLIELVMFDLVEQGRLEVIEDEEDEEFWAVQQVPGSQPPEPDDPWPGQESAGETDEEEEEEEEEEEDEIEDDEQEDEQIEDDEQEEDEQEQDEQEQGLDPRAFSPRELVYRYFETPKFPRQSLRYGGGIHSLLTYYTLPIQQRMVQRQLMRSVASPQGCASGCLLLVGIISLVSFAIGTFYRFAMMAIRDNQYLPLVVFVVALFALRMLMKFGRIRLVKIFGFLRPRSSLGERYLEALESRFDSMLPSPKSGGNGQGGKEGMLDSISADKRQAMERLAVAVFGSWVLAGGPYQDLAYYLGTADPEEPAGP